MYPNSPNGTMADEYGRWIWSLPSSPPFRCGIVIPAYGRPRLVKQCLESLAKSNLPDSVICIVDETNAEPISTIQGFRLFIDIDSPSSDLMRLDGSIEAISNACASDPRCVAFNSLGWLKHRLAPPRRIKRWAFTRASLYVKSEYCDQHPKEIDALRRIEAEFAEQKRSESETEEIVATFELRGKAIVKVFKHRHSQMFDSLKHGWDLLSDRFGCEYLACLDSDTVVKPDWLDQLLRTHDAASRDTSVLLVTGFNTSNHPVIAEKSYGYVKRSCGGINLFFHRSQYQTIIRPTLESIEWDHAVVDNVGSSGGHIVCTRPSVVQHIGKAGLWSNGETFDHAIDF